MTLAPEEIRVGMSGRIYFAPKGTPAPVDVTTPLEAPFVDVGYTTDDGPTFTNGYERGSVSSWQSKYPVRIWKQTVSSTLAFTMQQINAQNVQLAFGGGTVTTTGVAPDEVHRYDPPSDDDPIKEYMVVVEVRDGDLIDRYVVPRVATSEEIETQFTKSEERRLPVTLAVLGEDGVQPWYQLSNDPAMAPAVA